MRRVRGGYVFFGGVVMALFLPFSGWPAGAQDNFIPPSSNPTDLFVFKDHVYFVATDGIRGRELWRVAVPHGPAEIVAELTSGPGDSELDDFHVSGNRFYFIRRDPVQGGQLWVSDGEPGGRTVLVRGFRLAEFDSGVKEIVGEVNGQLVIQVGGHFTDGAEYWRSDGTDAGTVVMRRDNGGGLASNHVSYALHDGALYFDASLGGGSALWRYDGIHGDGEAIGWFDGPIYGLTSMPGQGLYFTAKTADSGMELWFTEGTADTTRPVSDIYPGPESSDPGHLTAFIDHDPDTPDVMLFTAMHPRWGRELWQTDGTEDGTQMVEDLVPGAGSSEPYKILASHRTVYMNARTPATGVELWVVDPHRDLPRFRLQADIFPGIESSFPYSFCLDSDGALYFSASNEESGEELWYSRGIGDETYRVTDLMPGSGIADPYYTVYIRDTVVFAATHPVYGRELWCLSNPEIPPLTPLADIYTDASINPSSSPDELTPLEDCFLFVADDLVNGRELWRSDGSQQGTALLADIYPGRIGSNPEQLARVGTTVYFAAESPDYGTELWASDGTTAGTAQQLDIWPGNGNSSGPMHLTACNGTLYFSAYRAYDGREMWTAVPGRKPVRVTNLTGDGSSSNPHNFVVWGEHVYFIADDQVHGEELWRTDGTAEGTKMVRDIVDRPVVQMSVARIEAWKGQLLITGTNGSFGQELWVMDSEGVAPRLLRDVAAPAALGVLRLSEETP